MLKKSLLLKYPSHEQPEYSVVVEQNKHVAYAYLLKHGSIVGDVWLYNVFETSFAVDWSNKKNLPFKNPLPFLKDSRPVVPAANKEDIKITWATQDNTVYASIYLRGELLVELNSNSTIGRSALVKSSRPLANTLEQ